jgi:predicted dehydrogenase
VKQVSQRLRDGRIEVLDVPEPVIGPADVLIDVRASVISAGTERAKVVTGRKSLIGKARSRPDQVRQVLDKARRDGVRSTVEAVRLRLDEPSPLGYSAAGVVLAVGARVSGLSPGDRVACAGGGYAVHAEVVRVPGNLCVRVPDEVSLDHAAFATIGAIALHGVRQTGASLGERVAVIGMGLVGQLAGQLLRAAGCVVVGIDLSEELLDLARSSGAADRVFLRTALDDMLPDDAAECDAVLITAATSTNDPIELAARLSRDRGRVVAVGDVHLDIPRAAFYEKELELRLSRSYGPGRYAREYEERGLDYPIGYVRWTERRNLEAFIGVLASRRIDVEPLITSRVPLGEAPTAYDRLADGGLTPLGIVLTYDERTAPPLQAAPPRFAPSGASRVGLIGAGSFAQRILVPAMKEGGFELTAVASATGLTAKAAATRFGFGRATTVDDVLAADDVDIVVIATSHSSHAALTLAALDAGKHVFVEKPPALDPDDLARIIEASATSGLRVAVGFNRRHAPLARRAREHVRETSAPIELLYRVNAGPIPADHWLNDLEIGGGRLVGEGCHIIDFACWVAGEIPRNVTAARSSGSFAITLEFADGSVATVLYGSGGAGRLGKEYVEMHAGGRSAVLDDFRLLDLYAGPGRRDRVRANAGKGHEEEFVALRKSLEHGLEPDDPSPLLTMAVTFAAVRAAESGRAVRPQLEETR